MIVAGGYGRRMGKVCDRTPKCLLEIGGKPAIAWQIDLLRKSGIEEITVCSGHLSQVVSRVLQDKYQDEVNIRISLEPHELGTAGCLRHAYPSTAKTALVVYGDLLISMDIEKLVCTHFQTRAIATVVAQPTSHPFDSDLLEVDETDRIRHIHRKPHRDDKLMRNLATAGVFVLGPLRCTPSTVQKLR